MSGQEGLRILVGRLESLVEKSGYEPQVESGTTEARLESLLRWIEHREQLHRTAGDALNANTLRLTRLANELVVAKTELEDSNRSLEQAHDYSSNIIDALLDTLVVLTPEGLIQLCQLLSFGDEELQGSPLHGLIHDQDQAATLLGEMADAVVRDREIGYRRKDGLVIQMSLSGRALKSAGGDLMGFVCIARDMTEVNRLRDREKRLAAAAAARVEAEKRAGELEQAYEQLRATQDQLLHARKMESIGRLVGAIAHDFNNILMVINTYAELILDELDQSSGVRADVAAILKNGQLAAALTSKLLTFARKQAQSLQIIDVRDLVEGVGDLVLKNLSAGIVYEVDIDSAPGHVEADRSQLEQVLMNLVLNARDAMASGGTVTLSARPRMVTVPELAHGSEVPVGAYAEIAVSDTGCGMSSETLANIFEPFFTTKSPGKGTGLGLATVYGVISQSKGHVMVDSELGKGTTFRCLFSQVKEPAAAHCDAGADQPEHATSGLVLVVEDEPDVRELIVRKLGKDGYEVLAAGDSEQALSLYGEHVGQVDLLLTDVSLPGMNGHELARELQRRDSRLKVLLMSGYPAQTLEQLGCDGEDLQLIAKPVSVHELLGRIRQLVAT